jgi:trans-2,3-dihydro-3-hydroxyanthranilate isomerase
LISFLDRPQLRVVQVFHAPGHLHGGNPAPIVLGADGMTEEEMRGVAANFALEAGFISRADDAACDLRMRYFVPNHEMEMCGHATVGALWLLREMKLWAGQPITIATMSGPVRAKLVEGQIRISQPCATLARLSDEQTATIAEVLNVDPQDILGLAINASTSRVKTLVHIADPQRLRTLAPHLERMRACCESLGSTGLYPFTIVDRNEHLFEARQFPKSSGYPEDAATGIAATALSYGLRQLGLVPQEEVAVRIRQGFSMGLPSEIRVQLPDARQANAECWLGGQVRLAEASSAGGTHG